MKTNNKELFVFCSNIRYLRKSHKLRLKEMAQICGINIFTLILLECNIVPSYLEVTILYNIFIHFKISPSQIFKGYLKNINE